MLVSSYNNKGLDDVLVIEMRPSAKAEQDFESRGNITRLFNKDSGVTVGFNIFNASSLLNFAAMGPVALTQAEVAILNAALEDNGFKPELIADESPKFVTAYVETCEAMKDSDHLNITQTKIDNEEVVQIVCGAANIAQGQKVVVAKPGAVLPDGSVIWPGKLRGVNSYGMICSRYELGLDPEHKQKGIMLLDDDTEVGKAFIFD